MPPDQLSQNSGVQIAIFRHRVSEILLHNTIYDVVPVSSKIAVLDARLPVKQAFKIMHDEGLSLVPLWDDQQQTVTGMLTASDFVLILRKVRLNCCVSPSISTFTLFINSWVCSCRETFELLAMRNLKCIQCLLGKKQNCSFMGDLMLLPFREGH
jgi:predicted transcriptional regulator